MVAGPPNFTGVLIMMMPDGQCMYKVTGAPCVQHARMVRMAQVRILLRRREAIAARATSGVRRCGPVLTPSRPVMLTNAMRVITVV